MDFQDKMHGGELVYGNIKNLRHIVSNFYKNPCILNLNFHFSSCFYGLRYAICHQI